MQICWNFLESNFEIYVKSFKNTYVLWSGDSMSIRLSQGINLTYNLALHIDIHYGVLDDNENVEIS